MTHGGRRRPSPDPPPARHRSREPPSRPAFLLSLGKRLAGVARDAKPPSGAGSQRHTPTPGAAQPRARQFRGEAGPPPTTRGSPGAGPAGRPRGPLRDSLATPEGTRPPRPHAIRRGVSGAGSLEQGGCRRGRWRRRGRGAGPGAGPHVPRPSRPMGARRSERSPYMDMFWGRARHRPARAPRFA